MARFRLGLNYWPARTAMGWWQKYDRAEVRKDFARIAGAGFDSIRIFLHWEHFQPRADRAETKMVHRLITTLDLALEAGLSVMPTLFTGHMSGANFIPSWALGGDEGDARFRVVSEGRVVSAGLRNWYTDKVVVLAQESLCGELAGALADHPALFAWDLGNENSNCTRPPTRDHGRDWLLRMTDAIRAGDSDALVTIGLHMEDLEQDRNIGPAEAAKVCDFLTMHGYPGYAPWSRGPTDEALLPFLAALTSWLGGGTEVLFSELGVPTYREGDPGSDSARTASSTELVEEHVAAAYIERSITRLAECGCTGAMLWCHADYTPAIWNTPPLDLAVHERFFGLWRADASPKPALDVIRAFENRPVVDRSPPAWIDLDPEEFQLDPSQHLVRLYGRYLETLTSS